MRVLRTLFVLGLGVAAGLACASAPPPPPPADEASVRPGVNRSFLSPDLDVARYTEVFEGESREIFRARYKILAQLDLTPGMAVADVGAGTGLFVGPLSRRVRPGGVVYALEIAPAFLDHLRARVEREALQGVEVLRSRPRSLPLRAASLDLALLVDTYHHFEFPRSMLASLYATLRPGGALVVVDFEREPGVSRQWVLDHVRAGRPTVIAEIVAAGFELEAELAVPGLEENYALRFRR